jgi:hypothetical protein
MDNHARLAGEFIKRIKRLLAAAATFMLLLSQLDSSNAAGPFDGQWTGTATSNRGRCKAANVTVTIAGKVVSGEMRLEGGTSEIRGTVWEDGSFGATIGFHHLTGQFNRDAFQGEFDTADCKWKMQLRRRPGTG